MFQRILLAVDGSEHSNKAVDTATEAAKLSGGEVLVLHVREHDVSRGVTTVESSEEATDVVQEPADKVAAAGVNVRGKVVGAAHGTAAKAILSEAADFNADVIVMGTRGLSDFAGLMVGSVAHKILTMADRPVLIVR